MTTNFHLAILDHLTRERPIWEPNVDAMTGGGGITYVERWPIACRTGEGVPWVWRLMWLADRPGWTPLPCETGTRIAYGVADSLDDATSLGRCEARRLAKVRRGLAKVQEEVLAKALRYDPDAPHTCSRCGMIENEDEHGQSVCEGCHQCSLCCGCGTFDDEEN